MKKELDQQNVIEVIEDALTTLSNDHDIGFARGIISTFYMCGKLTKEEWEMYLERLPKRVRTI